MIDALVCALIAVISYLFGSLNFGVILSKRFKKEDVRNSGSGNAGTTNMLRTYGKLFGFLTIAGDILKVFVAIILSFAFLKQISTYEALYSLLGDKLDITIKSFVGLFAVMGHIFPCYFNFKGGKGVATSGGMVIMIDWRIALILLVVFIFTIIFTKYVSLGSILMAILFPVFMLVFYKSAILTAFSLVFTIIVLVAHRENIKRLVNHTENKIGKKKDA